MRRLLPFVLLTALAATLGSSVAGGQAAPVGRITGTILMGTAEAALGNDLSVEFLVLEGSAVNGTIEANVRDGSFEVEAPLGPERLYVPLVVYRGVRYFDPGRTVTLTEEDPDAHVEVTVYETSDDSSAVEIVATLMQVNQVNPSAGEISLLRRDALLSNADRAFVGGPDGVTLRIPPPEGASQARGQTIQENLVEQDGILLSTTPITPGEVTIVSSEYVVEYNAAEDEYRLRVTVPFPADQIVIQVPADWVRDPRVDGPGAEVEPEPSTLSDGTEVELRTFVREDAAPGDSLVVVLDGLSPSINENLLTETPASIIAGIVALVAVGAGATYAARRGRTVPA